MVSSLGSADRTPIKAQSGRSRSGLDIKQKTRYPWIAGAYVTFTGILKFGIFRPGNRQTKILKGLLPDRIFRELLIAFARRQAK